jgi:hypothetical protein
MTLEKVKVGENWFNAVDFLSAAESVLASGEVPLNKTPNSLETELESYLGETLFSLSAESRDFEDEKRTDKQLEKAREECLILTQRIVDAIEKEAEEFYEGYEVYPWTQNGDQDLLIIGFWSAYVLSPYEVYRANFPINRQDTFQLIS